jgi:hypothetical protein
MFALASKKTALQSAETTLKGVHAALRADVPCLAKRSPLYHFRCFECFAKRSKWLKAETVVFLMCDRGSPRDPRYS